LLLLELLPQSRSLEPQARILRRSLPVVIPVVALLMLLARLLPLVLLDALSLDLLMSPFLLELLHCLLSLLSVVLLLALWLLLLPVGTPPFPSLAAAAWMVTVAS
jgi:hypothetical protein